MRIRNGQIEKRWCWYDLPYDQEFVDWPTEDAIVQVVSMKLRDMAAGKMGYSTSEVGDLVVQEVEQA